MKKLLAFLIFAAASTQAASDADVTIIKAKKVIIEDETITIVAEARSSITLIKDGHDPKFKGDTWHGMPVTRVQVVCDNGKFTIKRHASGAPGKHMEKAWNDTLKAAKDLQDGKEISGVVFYTPDIVIKGNFLDSMTGTGYIYPKAAKAPPAKDAGERKLDF